VSLHKRYFHCGLTPDGLQVNEPETTLNGNLEGQLK